MFQAARRSGKSMTSMSSISLTAGWYRLRS